MKVQVTRPLSALSVAAVLVFAPFAVSAQNTPMMGGEMKGGNMGDGMRGSTMIDDMMKGCDMMGGGMEHMQHMMSMMHEKMSHAGDRIASLKTELKITESKCRYGPNSPTLFSRPRSPWKSRWI